MTTATLTRLYERDLGMPGRVNRAGGIISGVKILGRQSKNNREYSQRALEQAANNYEGIVVNFDHNRTGGE